MQRVLDGHSNFSATKPEEFSDWINKQIPLITQLCSRLRQFNILFTLFTFFIEKTSWTGARDPHIKCVGYCWPLFPELPHTCAIQTAALEQVCSWSPGLSKQQCLEAGSGYSERKANELYCSWTSQCEHSCVPRGLSTFHNTHKNGSLWLDSQLPQLKFRSTGNSDNPLFPAILVPSGAVSQSSAVSSQPLHAHPVHFWKKWETLDSWSEGQRKDFSEEQRVKMK